MKGSLITALALVSAATAAVHGGHNRFHHARDESAANVFALEERDVCSSYVTYWTTFYGDATLVPQQPMATAAPATQTVSPVAGPTTTPSATPSASPSASPSSSSSGGGSSGAGLPSGGATGGTWAFSYTPYDSNGNCKSQSAVYSDMQTIKSKGFTTVRLYATDCSGPQNVGGACQQLGLSLILGIYIDSNGIDYARPQIGELTGWANGNWQGVDLIVVGNEAVFSGFCSASDLGSFVGEAKAAFRQAGYTGPVTTTEPLGTLQSDTSTFCSMMDIPASNMHAFFNADVTASGAGDFLSSQMDILCGLCGGDSTNCLNLESGWPSSGQANGAAVPGTSEQQTAIASIIQSTGSRTVIFSFENDSWKSPGAFEVEQYWGCADVFPLN